MDRGRFVLLDCVLEDDAPTAEILGSDLVLVVDDADSELVGLTVLVFHLRQRLLRQLVDRGGDFVDLVIPDDVAVGVDRSPEEAPWGGATDVDRERPEPVLRWATIDPARGRLHNVEIMPELFEDLPLEDIKRGFDVATTLLVGEGADHLVDVLRGQKVVLVARAVEGAPFQSHSAVAFRVRVLAVGLATDHGLQELLVVEEVVDPVVAFGVPGGEGLIAVAEGGEAEATDQVLPCLALDLGAFVDPEPTEVTATDVLRVVEVDEGDLGVVAEVLAGREVDAVDDRGMVLGGWRFLEELGLIEEVEEVALGGLREVGAGLHPNEATIVRDHRVEGGLVGADTGFAATVAGDEGQELLVGFEELVLLREELELG